MSPLLLCLLLAVALLVAAGLSGAATGLFTANRFRLRHRDRAHGPAARALERLLEDPSGLAVTLALLQTAARLACVLIALPLGVALGGGWALALVLAAVTLTMTLVVEMYPRAAALQRPERWARRGAPLVLLLHTLLTPVTRALMLAQRLVLGSATRPSAREGRARADHAAAESGPLVPPALRRRVTDELAAESATLADVLVPRSEIDGIDLDAGWDEQVSRLRLAGHRMLPAWRGTPERIEGLLDVSRLVPLIVDHDLDAERLRQALIAPYFVPVTTPLVAQLEEFQRTRTSLALAVDEYGDLQGLVSRTDVVAELAVVLAPPGRGVHHAARPEADGSWLVAGRAGLRSLNRALGWELPTDGPRTLNGLVLEVLESIPSAGTSLRIGRYRMEVVQVRGGGVRLARIVPPPPET